MTETIATPETEATNTVKAPRPKGKRGRPADMTPNKEFAAKKIRENDDGETAVYLISYNDANGVRCTREETRPVGRKGGKGRQPDRNPSKVLTPKFSRGADGALVFNVPFNDENGVRKNGVVTLSVGSDGNLSVAVS